MFDVFTPDVLQALWRGTQITLGLTALSSAFGLVLGFVAALGRLSRLWPLRALAGSYIEIFRGTPLLVQLFFLFFALPQLTRVTLPPFQTAVLGLSLFAGAYAAEIIRAGIEATPKGQIEAALSLAMSRAQTFSKEIGRAHV